MKVKYEHISEPGIEKIHDTEIALRNNPMITMNQDEFDAFTLRRFAEEKESGIVIKYKPISETGK